MSGLFFFPYVTSAIGVLLGVYLTNELREYDRRDYFLRACFIFVINLVISYLLEYAFPREAVGSEGMALSTAYYMGLSIYAVVPGLAFGRFTAFRARNMGHDKSVAYWSAIPFVFIYFMLVAHKREHHASPRTAG
ncbi:hypothetical protein JET14_01100 [Martelella lutilitoris]|uniref:Uncharacterized protein n=1 Tax=Martelella lutilitoris TaxID=2583532 RepID=A0A7T7HKF4_9HYPH|nr:hypothetical protein [Martelella lutilitoris]QQM30819.1 hypothetical protein JET14_01100 [Martelella lutilitoris]